MPVEDRRLGAADLNGLPPFERLAAVMAALRHPETGCPWDLRQTLATIAPYTIEEAYEVADSIARADWAGLKDELGDLLFNVVYHARLAEEAGHFTLADVAQAAAEKMIRRHPHVFSGDSELAEAARADLSATWEAIKAAENRARHSTAREDAPAQSALDGIPGGLPALLRTQKLLSRARRAGFDWTSLGNLLAKLDEELAELKQELDGTGPDICETVAAQAARQERIVEEFGDLMFVLVNLGARLGLEGDMALARANAKFEKRFRFMEAELRRRGLDFMSAQAVDVQSAWEAAKCATAADGT